jgi:hypothetical protein
LINNLGDPIFPSILNYFILKEQLLFPTHPPQFHEADLGVVGSKKKGKREILGLMYLN